MDPLIVTVPDSMKDFVQSEVASGGYSGPNDYIYHLLRAEQQRKAKEVLGRLVQEGLDTPLEEVSPAFWDDLRQQIILKSRARESSP